MKYLLDTSACVSVLRHGAASRFAQRLSALRPGEAVLCEVVRIELLYGALRSQNPAANIKYVDRMFTTMRSLPLDRAAADACASIRADLAAKGTPIGPYDALIAAIALSQGLIVVTTNSSEFARVPGLQCEDWTKP